MQRKFEEKLLRKKSQSSRTKPKSPNFCKTKQRVLDRDYVNEAGPKIESFKTHRNTVSAATLQVKQPSSTRAMEATQKKRREEIEAWKAKQEAVKREDLERKKRQERVSFFYDLICIDETISVRCFGREDVICG